MARVIIIKVGKCQRWKNVGGKSRFSMEFLYAHVLKQIKIWQRENLLGVVLSFVVSKFWIRKLGDEFFLAGKFDWQDSDDKTNAMIHTTGGGLRRAKSVIIQ